MSVPIIKCKKRRRNYEVRKKLDAILKAFGAYIGGQSVYSKKIGYVWILADYPCDAGTVVLDTPAKMLDRLFNDVVNADENKTHIPNALTLSEWEECEVRRQIAQHCWSRLLRTKTAICNSWRNI